MSDLISRQAAIDALHMHLMYRMGTDSNKKRLDDWINGVPSVQQEQRWVPVSERMPEEGQLVLTTIRGTDVIKVEDGETFEDAIDRSRKIVRVSVGFIGSDGWYGVDGYPEIVAPCAWKPLPEPWKEGEADGQR